MSGDPEEGRLRRGEGSVPRATSDGGTAGAEEARDYCRSAGERPDFFFFLAISPTHTALQTSPLPSSLLTRTQPQAEVRVTPSAVARAVARGWPKDESEISRAGFRAPAGGRCCGACGGRAGWRRAAGVGWEAGEEARS